MTDLVKLHVSLDPDEYGIAGEYIWAVPADDGNPLHYRISNIPFYAGSILALDDIVEVGPAIPSPNCDHGGAGVCKWCSSPEVVRGVKESGQETGRLYFETHLSEEERREIARKINDKGVHTEWADAHFLAFSFPADQRVGPIVDEWVNQKKIAVCDLIDID
jgi:hypothetical protein